MIRQLNLSKAWLALVLAATLHSPAAEVPTDKMLPVRGFCIPAPPANRLDEFIKFIEEELAPRSVNTLILRVDYGFRFLSRPEMADPGGLSKEQAQRIAATCRKHEIQIIPLVNLWGTNHGNLDAANCSRFIPSLTRRPQ